MLRVTIAASGATAAALAAELEYVGMHVVGVFAVEALEAEVFGIVAPGGPASASASAPAVGGTVSDAHIAEALARTDVLLVQPRDPEAGGAPPGPDLLGPTLLALCDRRGIRVVPLADGDDARRRAHALGWGHTAAPSSPAGVIAAIRGEGIAHAAPGTGGSRAQVFTVWGPGGAPGRSTIAIELAYELARGGRTVALVDADTSGASLALALGLPDEGPGFAAACRAAGAGMLDGEELERISMPIVHPDGTLRVLTGLNRPGRWPELTEERVASALEACRAWADYVVVDVAAPLERDEEIVSDLDGLRRHAATFGALRVADRVVAVASIEPVSIARFARGYLELRALLGATPVTVVANRLRPGALGVDARGQVRAALAQFVGVETVWFVPLDPRSADAAMLAAAPIGARHPNAPLVTGVRRVVGEALLGAVAGRQRHPEPDDGAEPSTRAHRFMRVRRRRAVSQRAEVGAPAT